MENIKLEDITIEYYLKLLRSSNPIDANLVGKINEVINEAIGKGGASFDLSLFMLQKDLLIFYCKLELAKLDGDAAKSKIYAAKIQSLIENVKKKTDKKKTESTPYNSFLNWLLTVEKFLGFAIDKSNDLLYLTEATKQMLNYYEQQKKQYEGK